jgi:hypothetical protein
MLFLSPPELIRVAPLPCSRRSTIVRHPWRLTGVRPRRSTLYLAIRTLTDDRVRSLPTKTAVHPKVEDNPHPLIYFLNYVLNLAIYRVIL